MTQLLFASRQINVIAPLVGVPTWATGLAVNQGVSIAGTDPGPLRDTQPSPTASGATNAPGGPRSFFAYNGACVRHSDATWFSGLGGGHGDYHGNDHMRIKLSDNAPAWAMEQTTSGGLVVEEPYATGSPVRPSARHSYWHVQFIQSQNKLVHLVNASGPGSGGAFYRTCDAYDVATQTWSPKGASSAYLSHAAYAGDAGARAQYQGSNGVGPAFYASVAAGANDTFYYMDSSGGNLHRYDAIADVWTAIGSSLSGAVYPAACDTVRSRILWLQGGTAAKTVNITTGAVATVTLGASFPANVSQIPGSSMEYVPEIDRFVVLNWSGKGNTNQLRLIDPVSWAVTSITPGGLVIDAASAGAELYGKFRYIPNIGGGVGGVAVCYGAGYNMAFVRLF